MFLILDGEVAVLDRIWIVKGEHSSFKSDIVLSEVLPVFVLVPFKSHRYSPIKGIFICKQCQYMCTYK